MKIFKNGLVLFFLSVIISSCSNSYETITKEELLKNENVILQEAYEHFWATKEYKNGTRMNPPMIFDKIYVYCLNSDEKNIDFDALEKEEFEVKWDDYSIKTDDIKEMIKNNIPIIQMSFHWIDPMSESGNNDWVNKTYFFPECEVKDNKIELGKGYPIESRINSIKYYPYYEENEANQYIGQWVDIKNPSISLKINFNGDILNLAELNKKNKAIINSTIDIVDPITGANLQVASQDFNNAMKWDEAMRACKELGDDWRLPTKEELKLIYEQLYKKGSGNFKTEVYWSSSEDSSFDIDINKPSAAFFFDFKNENANNYNDMGPQAASKDFQYQVRPVRSK
jgi:hypothetical protein